MSKVIKVTDDEVFVGTDGGQIVKIEKNKMTWFASVGDEVDVFTSNEETIIVKKENKKSSTIQIVDSKRPVNKLAYVLLALFFGGIGIHKFFAGNTGNWNFILAILLDTCSWNNCFYRSVGCLWYASR